jgi:hypothetical protein
LLSWHDERFGALRVCGPELRQRQHRTFREGINCELNGTQAALSPFSFIQQLDPTIDVSINNGDILDCLY